MQPYQIGVATSAGTFFQQLGGTIGIALFGAILTSGVNTGIQTNLEPVIRSAPAQLQGQLQQFGTAAGNGAAREGQGSSFDVEKAKGEALTGIDRGFDERWKALESAIRSGDPALLNRVVADPRLPAEARTGLGQIPPQAIATAQGQQAVLTELQSRLAPAREQAKAEVSRTLDGVDSAIKRSFTDAIAQIFRASIGVMLLAFLAVLMLPDRRLEHREPS